MIIILFGYDAFSGYQTFTTPLSVGEVSSMTMQNAIYDRVQVMESSDSSIDITKNKQEWSYYDKLLCEFMGNLEAGNLDNKGMPIEFIRVKRKKVDGSLTWDVLKDFQYEVGKELYELDDYYCENMEDYVYGISAVTASVEGRTNESNMIESHFETTFIIDKNNKLQLKYDIDQSDIEHVRDINLIHTLGSKYATKVQSQVNYIKSSVEATILSTATIEEGKPNLKAEIKNRKNIIKSLLDGRTKLIKSHSGLFILATITDVQESPNNDLYQQIYKVNISFAEIADAEDMEELKNNGLTY